MEKVASAFTPEDRIGALELQNVAVDNRTLLLHWMDGARRLGGGEGARIARILGGDRA